MLSLLEAPAAPAVLDVDPALVLVPVALVPVPAAADEVAPDALVAAALDVFEPEEPPQAATPSASAAALNRRAGCLSMGRSPSR
jgi:hypothetical protein